MRKLLVCAILTLAMGIANAQGSPFGFYDTALGASVSAQGTAVINGGPALFAYGAGLRGSAQINPIARLQAALEYMNRGDVFQLRTLDLSAIMAFGDPFFLGIGLYFGAILDMEPALGWDYFAGSEFGWAVDLGYRVPSIPGFTVGFDMHMALTDLMPEEYNDMGKINQLDIRWGLWLGYDFARGD